MGLFAFLFYLLVLIFIWPYCCNRYNKKRAYSQWSYFAGESHKFTTDRRSQQSRYSTYL